jgi:hypothetical protein
MARQQRGVTFDALTQLKDAGAVTASAAAQVAAAAKVLDLGTGRVDGVIFDDVSAIDTTSADEKYELEAQFSNDITFATGVVIGPVQKLGALASTGASANNGTGRYETPFTNEINGVRYRYMRRFHRIGGTTPSISYISYLGKTGGT